MCSSVGIEYLHQDLTTAEAIQICERFQGTAWRPGRQVMWSGVPRAIVQQWADAHGMQTLTTAMGPLMVHDHPQCRHLHKSKQRWSRYMHGASALFASHIAQGGGNSHSRDASTSRKIQPAWRDKLPSSRRANFEGGKRIVLRQEDRTSAPHCAWRRRILL